MSAAAAAGADKPRGAVVVPLDAATAQSLPRRASIRGAASAPEQPATVWPPQPVEVHEEEPVTPRTPDVQRAAGSLFRQGIVLDDAAVERFQYHFSEMDDTLCGKLDAAKAKELVSRVYPEASERDVDHLIRRVWADLSAPEGEEVLFDELLFCIDPSYHLETLEDGEWDLLADPDIALGPPQHCKQWLWAAMNVDEASRYLTKGDWLRRLAVVIQTVSQLAILTSIINMMVESEPAIGIAARQQGRRAPTWIVEAVTIAIFSVELLLRIASTPSQRAFWSGLYTWIDLLAILPFYLTEGGLLNDRTKGLAVLRIVRLTRLLRILKVGRHSVGIHLMVMSVRKALLPLLWLWFVLVLAMVLFSALVFQAETMHASIERSQGNQWVRDNDSSLDDAGEAVDIQSIHGGMWWAVVTLSTTGYGDAVPRTPLGKVVGALTMMCGVVLIAFPTTILTQQFTRVFEEYEQRRGQAERKAKARSRLLAEHFSNKSSPQGSPPRDTPPSRGSPGSQTRASPPQAGGEVQGPILLTPEQELHNSTSVPLSSFRSNKEAAGAVRHAHLQDLLPQSCSVRNAQLRSPAPGPTGPSVQASAAGAPRSPAEPYAAFPTVSTTSSTIVRRQSNLSAASLVMRMRETTSAAGAATPSQMRVSASAQPARIDDIPAPLPTLAPPSASSAALLPGTGPRGAAAGGRRAPCGQRGPDAATSRLKHSQTVGSLGPAPLLGYLEGMEGQFIRDQLRELKGAHGEAVEAQHRELHSARASMEQMLDTVRALRAALPPGPQQQQQQQQSCGGPRVSPSALCTAGASPPPDSGNGPASPPPPTDVG